MKREDLKRKCCVCGKITFHADTYGTHIQKDGINKNAIKTKYLGKWVEYNCINKIYN